jgi:hypothetical protein
LAELRFDWRALAFASIASLVAAMVFGALPSIQATRSNLTSALMGSTRSRWQQGLVVAQLAVAVLLLSGAGLLLRSYVNLTRVDTGFKAANVLIALMVAARTREIGVRMALGADAGKIATMVFAGAGKLLVLGAGLGFCLTFSV